MSLHTAIAADPLRGRRDHESRPAAHPEEVRLRQSALPAAAHADPFRPVPIPCAPRHEPAWIAVRPSTPTTHLNPS